MTLRAAGGYYPTMDDLLRDLVTMLGDLAPLRWMDRGLCAEIGDPDAWFPEKGASTRTAKRVCAACDVRQQCLDYALGTGQVDGVWGGTSPEERVELRRERRSAA